MGWNGSAPSFAFPRRFLFCFVFVWLNHGAAYTILRHNNVRFRVGICVKLTYGCMKQEVFRRNMPVCFTERRKLLVECLYKSVLLCAVNYRYEINEVRHLWMIMTPLSGGGGDVVVSVLAWRSEGRRFDFRTPAESFRTKGTAGSPSLEKKKYLVPGASIKK